jgi:hypothetical protein
MVASHLRYLTVSSPGQKTTLQTYRDEVGVGDIALMKGLLLSSSNG